MILNYILCSSNENYIGTSGYATENENLAVHLETLKGVLESPFSFEELNNNEITTVYNKYRHSWNGMLDGKILFTWSTCRILDQFFKSISLSKQVRFFTANLSKEENVEKMTSSIYKFLFNSDEKKSKKIKNKIKYSKLLFLVFKANKKKLLQKLIKQLEKKINAKKEEVLDYNKILETQSLNEQKKAIIEEETSDKSGYNTPKFKQGMTMTDYFSLLEEAADAKQNIFHAISDEMFTKIIKSIASKISQNEYTTHEEEKQIKEFSIPTAQNPNEEKNAIIFEKDKGSKIKVNSTSNKISQYRN